MALKLLSGIPFLDKHYGGMLLHQPLLVTGSAGAGKSALALQFIQKGLDVNQRCLYFTSKSAGEVYAQATAFGLPVRSAIHARKLTLLEFSGESPQSSDARELATHRFQQLLNLVLDQHIDRLAIDTMVPWIYPDAPAEIARFFESITRTLTEASVTVLYTMPTPASKPAEELYSLLEENFPTTLSMEQLGQEKHQAHLLTYPGATDVPRTFPVSMKPGQLLKSNARGGSGTNAVVTGPREKTKAESQPDLTQEEPSAFILDEEDQGEYRPSLPSTKPRTQKPSAAPSPPSSSRKSSGRGISFASSMLNLDPAPAKQPDPEPEEDAERRESDESDESEG